MCVTEINTLVELFDCILNIGAFKTTEMLNRRLACTARITPAHESASQGVFSTVLARTTSSSTKMNMAQFVVTRTRSFCSAAETAKVVRMSSNTPCSTFDGYDGGPVKTWTSLAYQTAGSSATYHAVQLDYE